MESTAVVERLRPAELLARGLISQNAPEPAHQGSGREVLVKRWDGGETISVWHDQKVLRGRESGDELEPRKAAVLRAAHAPIGCAERGVGAVV